MAEKERKNLDKALDEINRKYGKGSIMSLGEQSPIAENLISTGSLQIDKILGGGVARGRITEIFGMESSGKSTLCLQVVAECQRNGGTVAYIDVEQALDMNYAKKLGVDINDLKFAQPTTAEEALDIVDMLAKTGEVDLIIVDSVAALCPQAELDGEMGDVTIGLLARTMSKCLRKITGTLNDSNCAVIFINQIRQKISTGFSMGDPETTTGGNALKFFASQRIKLQKTTAIKKGEEVTGANVKIKVVKNKIANPMQVAVVPLVFGEGFSAGSEVVDLAIEYGFIEKNGGWFTTHNGERMQGKDSVVAYYKHMTTEYEDLKQKVKAKLAGINTEEIEVDPVTGEVIDE